MKFAKTVTITTISQPGVSKLQIPFPPLPTQHKIVEILEEVDNLRKLRQQADEKMKDLIPSLFVEMFGDPTTNPKGWEIARLSNIAKFKRGPFGGSLKKEIFVKEGYKVYEQKNAIYNDFNKGNYFIDKKKYDEMIAFAVQPDDLVVSCSGTMGKIAIVPHNVKKGIINQALLKMVPHQNRVSSLVLKMLIESEAIQSKYFKNTAGSAMQNVASVKVLKDIEVPLPPLPLQQEFAERVQEIEAEKERQAESKKKLDELFNSLMQRAFRGELVA
jgi:type I restriction enzyme S subunit